MPKLKYLLAGDAATAVNLERLWRTQDAYSHAVDIFIFQRHVQSIILPVSDNEDSVAPTQSTHELPSINLQYTVSHRAIPHAASHRMFWSRSLPWMDARTVGICALEYRATTQDFVRS